MFVTYINHLIDLAVDLVAIFLLAYALYFLRHRRADLLLAYITLNIGIFVAMSLLSLVRLDIALGFGLFAILSIIRLRSSAVTQQEVAYYFVALILGLVNGMSLDDRLLEVGANLLLLLTMLVVDSRRLRERARRVDVTLDVVHADEAALVADLERRLGGRVLHHEVNDVDYVRATMVVDVRYRAEPGQALPSAEPSSAPPDPEERRLEITLDTVHADDAALVTDLERRLNGQVGHHVVKEINYVRDTMVVDVRYRTGSRSARSDHSRPSQPQPGRPNFGQPHHNQPLRRQPPSGQPHYPQPSPAHPHHPRNGHPNHPRPQQPRPQHSQPQHNLPQHNLPQHDQPQHDQPQHDQPQNDQPVTTAKP